MITTHTRDAVFSLLQLSFLAAGIEPDAAFALRNDAEWDAWIAEQLRQSGKSEDEFILAIRAELKGSDGLSDEQIDAWLALRMARAQPNNSICAKKWGARALKWAGIGAQGGDLRWTCREFLRGRSRIRESRSRVFMRTSCCATCRCVSNRHCSMVPILGPSSPILGCDSSRFPSE